MLSRPRWIPLLALLALVGCRQSGTAEKSSADAPATTATSSTTANPTTPAAGTPAPAHEVTLPSGLKYQDLKVGDGALAEAGMTAVVHYTGWLTNGTKFDSSLDRGQPWPFRIGAGAVIRGWDEGVPGMRVGGKRKLTIPPDLGYGEAGYPPVIPGNATLVFEVELLSVR